VDCEVLAVEPNRLIRYSWHVATTEPDGSGPPLDTVVTFVLSESDAGGTHLRITQDGFPLMRPHLIGAKAWSSAPRPSGWTAAPRCDAAANLNIPVSMRWAA
jgi:uncharacterized protein YndB with AHSA1/START domain